VASHALCYWWEGRLFASSKRNVAIVAVDLQWRVLLVIEADWFFREHQRR
jgi:hypothetical protein